MRKNNEIFIGIVCSGIFSPHHILRAATLAPIYLGDAVYEVLRSAAEDL